MDYKDKLRLAKEALDSGSYDKKTIEYIFPELKESKSERIRQRIIKAIRLRREFLLAIWDLGNEWKELTNGSISTEYGTQLDYIQKHWKKLHGKETARPQQTIAEVVKSQSKSERIRKVIYGWICTQPSQFFDNGFSKEEMLAWLEKQGEQLVSTFI